MGVGSSRNSRPGFVVHRRTTYAPAHSPFMFMRRHYTHARPFAVYPRRTYIPASTYNYSPTNRYESAVAWYFIVNFVPVMAGLLLIGCGSEQISDSISVPVSSYYDFFLDMYVEDSIVVHSPRTPEEVAAGWRLIVIGIAIIVIALAVTIVYHKLTHGRSVTTALGENMGDDANHTPYCPSPPSAPPYHSVPSDFGQSFVPAYKASDSQSSFPEGNPPSYDQVVNTPEQFLLYQQQPSANVSGTSASTTWQNSLSM